MVRSGFWLPCLLICAAPAAAQDSCGVCFGSDAAAGSPPRTAAERPLTLEITAGIEFSRMALAGQGTAAASIDPQTGTKRTQGGMVDLGGLSVQGRGRISGMPGRSVRIDLPARVAMTSANGASAQLSDFNTDLPAFPVLDGNGSLEFTFGARLQMQGALGGNLRGRIPISVDYN